MCEFASFLARLNPDTEAFEFLAYDLESHGRTREHHGIKDSHFCDRYNWIDVHYEPNEQIDARGVKELEYRIRERWPTFEDFWKDISRVNEVKSHEDFEKWKVMVEGDVDQVTDLIALSRMSRMCLKDLESAKKFLNRAIDLGGYAFLYTCTCRSKYGKQALVDVLTDRLHEIPYTHLSVNTLTQVIERRLASDRSVPFWAAARIVLHPSGSKVLCSYSKSKLRKLIKRNKDDYWYADIDNHCATMKLLGVDEGKWVEDKFDKWVWRLVEANNVAALMAMDRRKLKRTVNGPWAAHILLSAKNDIVLEVLSDLGFDPTKGNPSAMELAVARNQFSAVKRFAEDRKVIRKLKGKFGSDLFGACASIRMFNLLLRLGAKPPRKSKDGRCLLAVYACRPLCELTRRLLRYGVCKKDIDEAIEAARASKLPKAYIDDTVKSLEKAKCRKTKNSGARSAARKCS